MPKNPGRSAKLHSQILNRGNPVLSGVTVSCFLLSYLVVFALEAGRVFFKVPGRNAVVVTMLIAGLVAHTAFLVNQLADLDGTQVLANWFQWVVLAAWGLAIAYLVLFVRNPRSSIGIFLLPLILGLVVLGMVFEGTGSFKVDANVNAWRVIHGVSLLLSTMIICFGMAFAGMYLFQSYRLKSRKKRRRKILELPTLEFLQTMNRYSIFATSIALLIGLLSGIALNSNREAGVPWLSLDILLTCALFLWSVVASLLELAERGSLGGRRSAYLSIANFLFLLFVLGILMFSAHGQAATDTSQSLPDQSSNVGAEDRKEVGS